MILVCCAVVVMVGPGFVMAAEELAAKNYL